MENEDPKAKLLNELLPAMIENEEMMLILLQQAAEGVKRKTIAVRAKLSLSRKMLAAAKRGNWKMVQVLHGEKDCIREPNINW